MQRITIIMVVIVLILGLGYIVTNNNNQPEVVTKETRFESATEVTTNFENSTAEDEVAEETSVPSADIANASIAGIYTTYNADVIAKSKAEHILLFFKANWCPSCRTLDADIIANADQIPAGVEIYTVDYDTATELKRQYKITTQHSIIEIKADGSAQSGISHGLTLADVLATI